MNNNSESITDDNTKLNQSENNLSRDSCASIERSPTNDHNATISSKPQALASTDNKCIYSSEMYLWRPPGQGKKFNIHTADLRPGEYVMRTLFNDFTIQASRKMDEVMAEPLEKPLCKVLQRGEDAHFDQLIMAFGLVAEHCLPSLLRTLFAWYERQLGNYPEPEQGATEAKKVEKGKSENTENKEAEWLQERRDLAVEFIFCLVLIEVLQQLSFHPGHEDLVNFIENVAFKHFKHKEGVQNGPNASNIHTLADLFAEVTSILAQSRFQSVRKRFTAELKELRAKEPSPFTTHSIISLLMGMKFFRIKMVPIEEFEASFLFMQDCAQYFLEVKDKDIKHALAGLFVEILVPVAASVKNEVNVPCLKNFVDSLYSHSLDICTKSKHRLAIFPLVTCLLCVSQKVFFLQNWHYFLAMCLSHLKNRDPKISRVALESLYRLLWVYMIRIKCESNSATLSRLQSIVNSLFPKGSKAVVPRDTPLNIFVKIIQFIAQERLDFAMREIVFDLLSVGRPVKLILTPERMSIGLRAFLVVADSLQQKEGEPPMPRTSGVLPSGNTLRVKKTFLNKMLTEDMAKSIGMHAYFPHVRRVFVDILRALDVHYGRPLMMINTQNVNKEPDEMLTGERKPKIDLFRTCVAAVPRLIPDAMTSSELVDMLVRLTVHVDEELRALAYQSLQTLLVDFPDWRQDVILGFTQFLSRDLQDTFPQLVDNGMRMLLQLLTSWKNSLSPIGRVGKDIDHNRTSLRKIEKSQQGDQVDCESMINILHQVEAFSLVMLCNCRVNPRRLSVHILREVKCLLKLLVKGNEEKSVIDVIDQNCSKLLEKCLSILPPMEKTAIMTSQNAIDLQWIVDRNSSIWTAAAMQDDVTASTLSLQNSSSLDAWTTCLFWFLHRDILPKNCSSAVAQSWPIVYNRLHTLYAVIDPTPVSDNRASILRSSVTPRKPVSERDQYMALWRSYVIFAMRVVPPAPNPVIRCASPDLSLSLQGTLNLHNFLKHAWEEFENDSYSLNCMTVSEPKGWRFRSSSSPDNMATGERSDSKFVNVSPGGLYKLVIPLLRCEVTDVKDAAVLALSSINSDALKDLMEELATYIREAIDRKQENMRRRRRRDALRLHLVRVFELIAEHGTFGASACVIDRDKHCLHTTIVEYIDGARLCLEMEPDKDSLRDIKLHFCNFIRKMIRSFPLEAYQTLLSTELRSNLFSLFASWSGSLGNMLCSTVTPSSVVVTNSISDSFIEEEQLKFAALQAMCSVLCCGPSFNQQSLMQEDSLYYQWLDSLLASSDEKVYRVACETVILLMECNTDVGTLLDWVIDRCYTAEAQVADGCFMALATIFSAREYPCDHYIAVINVTLMSTGSPRTVVNENARQLLQILDKRFFGSVSFPPTDEDEDDIENNVEAEEEQEQEQEQEQDNANLLLSTTYRCTQMQLSQQLSQLHPQLTMPIFSEITHRFQTARPEVRQLLLQYLMPWLYNMELVDPNVPPSSHTNYFQSTMELRRRCGGKEGCGSAEATEMVLNNLFYITAKYSDEHPKEIEKVWATLCSCWANNLRVIIRYLVVVSGMAPNELLPYAKRVTLYLSRARPEKLLDEMLTELQTVETLNCLIERTETPPFYRLTSIRKISACSDSAVDQQSTSSDLSVEKGMIHTKRHSGDDCISSRSDGTSKFSRFSNNRINRMKSRNSFLFNESHSSNNTDELQGSTINCPNLPEENYAMNQEDISKYYDVPQPRPLPMPEYGGYFAPLTEYIPIIGQPNSGFHRCNLAVMLLTDVVIDSIDLDWSVHVPLMLHVLFLGMDQSRNLIHQHCKQLLLNLLIVLADHSDYFSVAQILLNNKTQQLDLGMTTTSMPTFEPHNFTETDEIFDAYLQVPMSNNSQSSSLAVLPSPSGTENTITSRIGSGSGASTIVAGEPSSPLSVVNNSTITVQDVVKCLIDFISARKDQVLWNYEDITAKVWSVRSVEQMDIFLQHILKIFQHSMPHALISERWAQTALQLGLSCSSRHYAGRSLQVFRFLRVPISSRMLSDILSRLVETIAEQGEDMQGYVTELLLTLESAVDSLDSDFRPLDCMKEIFKSTPNLNKDIGGTSSNNMPLVNKRLLANRQNTNLDMFAGNVAISSHTRSTSYSISYCMRRAMVFEYKDGRREYEARCGNLYKNSTNRSRSAQSLKHLGDSANQDDKMTILAQLFWVAISILESDYEHEYLLALRLLSRVLYRLPLDRPDAVDKLEKIFNQLKWMSFPGVHSLLLKGCLNSAIYESVVPLLSEVTPFLDFCVIDPTQSLAFPMSVIALLPYMLLHYEDANEICIASAENIAQVSAEKGKKLENLGTVMTLYSRRTFSKESFQWTKCVVKYLHDIYSSVSCNLLAFLIEMLEKGPTTIQLPVLNIIHCMLHYIDFNSPNQPFNSELLSVITRFIEGIHHKEAMKILKLVVTRSSSLVAAPSSFNYPLLEMHYNSSTHPTFADLDVFIKKELPGRTMDFTFDISQTPVIGRRDLKAIDEKKVENDESRITNTSSHSSFGLPRRSSSLSPADNNSTVGWKRPWLSQSRVRECLVSLLTTCGQRVGLPKSPSVIFSQTSDLLEKQSSMASSTEEVSAPDLSADSRRNESQEQFGVFKDFDFLEYESESVEGESTDNFNWGVRRRPLSSGDIDNDLAFADSQHPDSLSEKTPLLTVRASADKMLTTGLDDSSDEELGSESPLDDVAGISVMSHDAHSSSSTSLQLHRDRRDSETHSSDISVSSTGELGELTPCNTSSPNLQGMVFRSLHKDDSEQMWKSQIYSLIEQTPSSPLQLFHLVYKLTKIIVNKSIELTEIACSILCEFNGSNKLQNHMKAIVTILGSNEAKPIFVWFNENKVKSTEAMKFTMLQLKEHLDTFIDRKDHVIECIGTLKAVLKLQQLHDESVATETISEESILDIGKSMYKFHFQLLLIFESVYKLHSMLTTITQNKFENVSDQVYKVKEALTKTAMENSSCDERSPSPQLVFPDESIAMFMQFIDNSKWNQAFDYIRHDRLVWSSEKMSLWSDENEVTKTLCVYCNALVESKPECFVMLSEGKESINSNLMDELLSLLSTINEIEHKVKEQKERNYACH